MGPETIKQEVSSSNSAAQIVPRKQFEAVVIVPENPPVTLAFESDSMDLAKSYLERYVTSYFPGTWAKQNDGALIFSSSKFFYSITLRQI